MVSKEDYKKAKQVIQEYEKEHLNISDVDENFDEDKMKMIVPYFIIEENVFCNELRFIIKRFLSQNHDYLTKVKELEDTLSK